MLNLYMLWAIICNGVEVKIRIKDFPQQSSILNIRCSYPINLYIYIHTHAHICVCPYIYVYMYTLTDIYVCVCMYMN